jgi:hypothetical protein
MKKKSKQIGIIILLVIVGYLFLSLFTDKEYIVQYLDDGEMKTEIVKENDLDDLKITLDSSGTQYWIEVY